MRVRIILLMTLGILVSCETVVNVNLEPYEPELVVFAVAVPDSAWTASVSHSVAALDNREPGPVSGARVEILTGESVIAMLTELDVAGVYRSEQSPAAAGQEYTLRVSAAGYKEVSAKVQVPRPVAVSGVMTTLTPTPDREHPATRRATGVASVMFSMSDPPGVRDYYRLQVVQSPNLGQFDIDDPAITEDLLDFDSAEQFPFYGYVDFTDRAFSGERRELNPQILYSRGSRVVVQLLHVSESYREHLRTRDLQLDLDENPFAEPQPVYSNVTNGLGDLRGLCHYCGVRPDTGATGGSGRCGCIHGQ